MARRILAVLGLLVFSSAKAETLTGAAVDSINTFESPNAVVPRPIEVKVQNGNPSLTVAPRSVTVVSIEP
jgi:alpha-N-arabinofuranosidase